MSDDEPASVEAKLSAHWQAIGQPWRTEPEISVARAAELRHRRDLPVDVANCHFPFSDFPLTRADIEWLLANHPDGGPVTLKELDAYPRKGIDLRGAKLDEGTRKDLHSLPLVRLRGGLTWYERSEMVTSSDAWLRAGVNFAGCDLHQSHLEHANLFNACLDGADLTGVHFDRLTDLARVSFGSGKKWARLLDVRWGKVDLSGIDWNKVEMTGEERAARDCDSKDPHVHADLCSRAVRSTRQLAKVLRDQGLDEEADQFFYKAQTMQRRHDRYSAQSTGTRLGRRIKLVSGAAFSWLLWLVAGYGYRIRRVVLWYLIVVLGFAAGYFMVGAAAGKPFSPLAALVFSLSAFHGRGFFPSGVDLTDPRVMLATAEAVVGLFIEVIFIATFTRRFIGR